MDIDNNPLERAAMEAFLRKDRPEGERLQDEFLAQFHEAIKEQDHCPCKAPCKHHGKCRDCVAIHRGHRHHLPVCFRSMVNEKIKGVAQLAEHTLYD